LLEVTATKDGTPFKGVVLKVSKKRQDIVQAIGTHKRKKLFFFFSGISASPDTAFAL
jgi:cystathionine beta-lyase family protein involved in aluminum resistance